MESAKDFLKLLCHSLNLRKSFLHCLFLEIPELFIGVRGCKGSESLGVFRIKNILGLERREEIVGQFLFKQDNRLVNMRQDKAIHADHTWKHDLIVFCDLVELRQSIRCFLNIFHIELDPTCIPLCNCILMIIPDINRCADRSVCHGHYNWKPHS